MWLYRKNNNKFPLWSNDIPRRNVPWDMIMIATDRDVYKVFEEPSNLTFTSLKNIWWSRENDFGSAGILDGIDVDSDGNVYVSSVATGASTINLYKFDWQDGTLLWQTNSGGSNNQIRWSDGYLYVANTGQDLLEKYGATTGNFIWSVTCSNPFDIDVDSSGNVYVGGSSYLKAVTSTGSYLWETNEPAQFVKVYSNYIYTARDPARISVTTFTGSIINQFDAGLGVDEVWGLDVNSGYITFSTEVNKLLQIWNRTSLTIHKTFSLPNYPAVTSFNRNNELIVTSGLTYSKYSATFSKIWDRTTPDNAIFSFNHNMIARYTY